MEQIDIEGVVTKASRITLGTWAMGGGSGAAVTRTMPSAPSMQPSTVAST